MRRYGESKTHEKAKEKVAQVLKAAGWNVNCDDYEFSCQTAKGPRTYWPDVYAENFCFWRCNEHLCKKDDAGLPKGCRRIIVEIQGFAGHKSKAAFQADRLRIQDIRDSHGQDIEYYTVHLNRRIGPLDIRSWTVEDIKRELNLK